MDERTDLVPLLEDYHRRRALGEAPDPDDYRETAGEGFPVFARIVEAERMLDDVLEESPAVEFPMPFGNYTLLSELGRGAVGVVYEDVDRRLGRTVALKILKSGFDTQPETIERFRREARACAQVRHDHIVEIYEAGDVDGRHFYAMAVLRGTTLAESELTDSRAAAEAAAGVADALEALHRRGIVHRDVKPRNIVVEPTGRMVLADFGLARTISSESLTQTGEMLGTPLYMSPEQLLGVGGEIDGRSDVYCLGASLYEALSGRRLFQAENMAHLMRMILKERPRHLHEVAPHVPADLANIVMKALEKRSRDRYETAAAMRDDLLAFARGEKVVGRPVALPRRLWRRHRRWLPAAAIVALAATLFAALQSPAPAVVSLASVPPSTVTLNGVAVGDTPLRLEVDPGEHTVVFSRSGWEDRRRELSFEEGEKRSLEVVLRPSDPGDPKALRELADGLAIELAAWDGISRTRSVPENGIEILFPRGRVRPVDVARARFVVGAGFAEPGAIVFRVNGEELVRRAVDDSWPATLDTTMAVPDEVRRRLEPGSVLEWGFVPGRGPAALVRCEVVSPGPRLAWIEERLRDQPAAVRDLLTAQVLLDEGLACSAYAVAGDVPHPVARAIRKQALESLGLRGSTVWVQLATAR